MVDAAPPPIIWEPDAATIEAAELTRLLRWLRSRGVPVSTYDELWRWSIADVGEFWSALWDFYELRGRRGDIAVTSMEMPGARWFPDATTNFGEHMLLADEHRLAVIAANEAGERRQLSYGELRGRVGAAQAELRRLGVGRGDRVVALMGNTLETLVAFVACAGLGAIWSSCSPEFGTQAVLDRFAQLEPVVLLTVASYRYGGKRFDKRADIARIEAGITSLRATIILDDHGSWSLNGPPQQPSFEALPFEHPLWVLYSSGTTGLPKGIVHSHGGMLLESTAVVRLHLDVKRDDRFFWFTTTGWMMWNVVIAALLSGATAVLYDGSPMHPDPLALWRLADEAAITFMGVSASYIVACRKHGREPRRHVDLTALRALGSTGSPLSADGFHWIQQAVKNELPIFSISGGTDICGSFLGSSVLLPVRAGELQCRLLGVDLQAWNEEGLPVVGEVGELVVTKPMPSMPIFLWNDPTGERLRDTYFSFFPGVWRHGDWVTITDRGSAVVHGRSDATLNRGGVRMGTAELCDAIESHPRVRDSLAVEDGPDATTAQLVLFVVLDGGTLDPALTAELRRLISQRVSPRHVPDEIIEIDEVPRTLNGKKLEVPVKRLLQGVPLSQAVSLGSVANPHALEAFIRAKPTA